MVSDERIERTAEHLGARVRGVDPTTMAADELSALLAEHHVLVFDPCGLDDADQQALLDTIGEAYIHPLALLVGADTARCGHIVDDADHPPYQDGWHTDVTWDPNKPHIGSLRAIEMPPGLGDTVWANMHVAYEALSDELKRRIEPLTAVHGMGVGTAFITKTSAELVDRAREAYPGVERPVVGTHRSTGQPYLNVNSAFTERLVGLDPTEGDALLAELYAHIADERWHYRHAWTEGELVIWDEESTQHRATAEHYPQRREMSRYAIRQPA